MTASGLKLNLNVKEYNNSNKKDIKSNYKEEIHISMT